LSKYTSKINDLLVVTIMSFLLHNYILYLIDCKILICYTLFALPKPKTLFTIPALLEFKQKTKCARRMFSSAKQPGLSRPALGYWFQSPAQQGDGVAA